MKTCVAVVILLFSGFCVAQNQGAYPEPEAAAAWRGLAASYVRKALKDRTLNRDPALNARVDAVMATVGAAVAAIEPRFADASWKAILIEDFGHGAAAFPGETILVDAKFVRALQLNDDELAFMLCHEAAHVVAGHASAKLSFMAEFLGKEKVPTARAALQEFFARDSYAAVFQPAARLQEREADALGAAFFLASGHDPQRALKLFDKLVALESIANEAKERKERDAQPPDPHDAAGPRKEAVAGAFAELRQSGARRFTAAP